MSCLCPLEGSVPGSEFAEGVPHGPVLSEECFVAIDKQAASLCLSSSGASISGTIAIKLLKREFVAVAIFRLSLWYGSPVSDADAATDDAGFDAGCGSSPDSVPISQGGASILEGILDHKLTDETHEGLVWEAIPSDIKGRAFFFSETLLSCP